jgi:cytochrome c oxidase cbb3-type subunit 4
MTLDVLRGLGTILALIAFCGICLWVYSGKRKAGFDAAAQLPFADDDEDRP